MTEIFQIVIENLEKVGIGALLFLGAYMSNVCLGAWRSVKIEGYEKFYVPRVYAEIKKLLGI